MGPRTARAALVSFGLCGCTSLLGIDLDGLERRGPQGDAGSNPPREAPPALGSEKDATPDQPSAEAAIPIVIDPSAAGAASLSTVLSRSGRLCLAYSVLDGTRDQLRIACVDPANPSGAQTMAVPSATPRAGAHVALFFDPDEQLHFAYTVREGDARLAFGRVAQGQAEILATHFAYGAVGVEGYWKNDAARLLLAYTNSPAFYAVHEYEVGRRLPSDAWSFYPMGEFVRAMSANEGEPSFAVHVGTQPWAVFQTERSAILKQQIDVYQPTTLDAPDSGTTGYAPAITSRGDVRVAAYFRRTAGPSSRAELVVSAFSGATRQDAVLMQDVDATLTRPWRQLPSHVALALDDAGRIHVAVAVLRGQGQSELVHFEQQAAPALTFASHVLDTDVVRFGDEDGHALVRMEIAPGGRRCIVYRSGVTKRVLLRSF